MKRMSKSINTKMQYKKSVMVKRNKRQASDRALQRRVLQGMKDSASRTR